MRIDRIAMLLASLAAISCAKLSVVGTSGEPEDSQVPSGEIGKPPHDPPKFTSTITPPPGMMLGFNQPILGDVDGDGLDDFLVLGSYLPTDGPTLDAPGVNLTTQAFLFYGKSQLAASLSTADADAVFEADQIGVWATGDVNGDGLADFAIGHKHSYQIVFGDGARYAGMYAADSVGMTWTGAPLPPPVASDVSTINAVRGAGDVDGDGVADLLVTVSSFDPQSQIEGRVGFGLYATDYLVLGHRGEWASAAWDPSLAAASFGVDAYLDGSGTQHRQTLSMLSAGDLDGDGAADLIAQGKTALFVFYGGAGELVGRLDASAAAASFIGAAPPKVPFELELQPHALFAIGDLDGDGASDLGLVADDTLGVVYGPKSRWSGETQPTPDYVIDFSSEKHAIVFAAAQSGDVDGDGAPELVIMTQGIPPDSPLQDGSVLNDRLYILHGTPERALGTYLASPSDIHALASDHAPTLPVTATFTSWPQAGTMLSLAGDLDGDGSCDIVTGHPGGLNDQLPQPEVYVIPSTPRNPD